MVHAGLLACESGCELAPSIQLLQTAFPGSFSTPVTGCDVLAYSCAAARDLHPLPIAPVFGRPTIMREPNLRKSKTAAQQIYRARITKSNACEVKEVKRRQPRLHPDSRAAGNIAYL
jgi:hypothetical protein